MSFETEIVITGDASGQLWNLSVWDLHSGTSCTSYKGGTSRARTLSLIGEDYIMSSEIEKPVINLWGLQRKERQQLKFSTPGRVSSLAVSSDGLYCVAGIEEKLYVWQVSSGNLLAIVNAHYQSVTCVKFTDDGSQVVSAGEDGMMQVWFLQQLLCASHMLHTKKSEPRFVWESHTLPITDLYVGKGGLSCLVATSSMDGSCKLYDLASGNTLASLVIGDALTAVTMDPSEFYVFLGSESGKIYRWNLSPQADGFSSKYQATYSGHKKSVTCLAVSSDGRYLVSGSADNTANVWDVPSCQCLRTVLQKGAVTNVLIVRAPPSIISENSKKATVLVSSFKRHLATAEDTKTLNVLLTQTGSDEEEDKRSLLSWETLLKEDDDNDAESKKDLSLRVRELEETNRQLFIYSVNAVMEQRDD